MTTKAEYKWALQLAVGALLGYDKKHVHYAHFFCPSESHRMRYCDEACCRCWLDHFLAKAKEEDNV